MPIRGDMLYDKRIVDRNIRTGLISRKDYEKHIKALQDLKQEAVEVEATIRPIEHAIPYAPDTDEDEL
jgi:nitrogen regulatory protein PII-like uncharacterized protein